MEIINLFAPTLAAASYFGAAIRLTAFDRGCRCYKWQISLLASVLIGVLLCAGLEMVLYNPETSLAQSLIAFLFFVLTIRAKGNVSHLLGIFHHDTTGARQ